MEFVTRNFCPPRVPHMTAEGERRYKFQRTYFVRTEGFGCEPTECSLTATLQSMCPGECFRFLPSRATRGISASVKASWLDGLHGKVDHCWTWRRRFKTYCFPFFFVPERKKEIWKKSGKRSFCVSQKTGSYVLLTMKKRVYLFQWLWNMIHMHRVNDCDSIVVFLL